MTLADTSTARMTHLILQCHQNATKATASQFSNSTPPRLLRIATTSGVESLDRLCLGALSLERLWRDPNCPKSENLQSVEFPATKKLFGCLHPSSTLLPRLCCTPWLDVNQKTMHVEERLRIHDSHQLKLWHMPDKMQLGIMNHPRDVARLSAENLCMEGILTFVISSMFRLPSASSSMSMYWYSWDLFTLARLAVQRFPTVPTCSMRPPDRRGAEVRVKSFHGFLIKRPERDFQRKW